MNRLEQLRQVIDGFLAKLPDTEQRRCAFIHLYGVSATGTILALKRGLDSELCAAAGMLHDIWNYQVGESSEHAQLGAREAKNILQQVGSFSAEDIEVICHAIARHTDKQSIDSEVDELLKDADVLQHYLYNPDVFEEMAEGQASPIPAAKPMHIRRLERTLVELGLPRSSLSKTGFTGD